MSSNSDRRRLSRYHLGAGIQVINQMTGECLGTVADIHLEGMMLMVSGDIGSDHLYQVKLQTVGTQSEDEGIELGLDCLWVREMSQEDRFWAGFRIIDVSEAASKKLAQLIAEFGEVVQEESTVS